jgi:hypothetical protein
MCAQLCKNVQERGERAPLWRTCQRCGGADDAAALRLSGPVGGAQNHSARSFLREERDCSAVFIRSLHSARSASERS